MKYIAIYFLALSVLMRPKEVDAESEIFLSTLENAITIVPTNFRAQYGIITVEVPYIFREQCKQLSYFARKHAESNTKSVLEKLAYDCRKFRQETFLAQLQELETNEFVSRVPDVRSRIKRDVILEEKAPITRENAYADFFSNIIPPVKTIIDHNNEDSTYNTVHKHTERLNLVSKVVNHHTGLINHLKKDALGKLDSVQLLYEGLNTTVESNKQFLMALPDAIRMTALALDEIQKDTMDLRDIFVGLDQRRVNIDLIRRRWDFKSLAVKHSNLNDCYYEDGKMKNMTINSTMLWFNLEFPAGRKDTVIVKTFAFKQWIDSDHYKTTDEEAYILHDKAKNCSKYIPKPADRLVYQSCEQENRTISEPKFKGVQLKWIGTTLKML